MFEAPRLSHTYCGVALFTGVSLTPHTMMFTFFPAAIQGAISASKLVKSYCGLLVGPRSALKHQWDRLVLQSDEWKPRFGQRILFDDDIEVGVTIASDQRPPDCRELSATLTVCTDLKRFSISGSRAPIDAYEYDASFPEAALSYALDARTATPTIEDLQAGPAEQGSKCRLQLVGVPFNHLTTKAWIGCADWLHEARRLKELVAPWFAKTPE